MKAGWIVSSWLLTTAACGHGPAVMLARNTLPLQRVVVYRNGVGYFERRGHVNEDHVEFRVRQSEVGDFLATLTVMEQGGSSVRSAAFPMPENNATNDDAARRAVRLQLDGASHDLLVGYMIETPIWRPSYRLVLGEHRAEVQAWGIVQNVSGEDWTNVRLSLVAGAPVSFRSQLAEAVISDRPTVTDRGEVIENVPHTETAIAQNGSDNAPAQTAAPTTVTTTGATAATEQPPEAEPDELDALAEGERAGGGGGSAGGMRRMAPAHHAAGAPRASMTRGPVATTPPPPPAAVSTPRNVASLAAVAVQGGVSRYDLPQPVTVPEHSATMVMLAAREVPGEAIYLYAPDPGVPDSASHPFHVARFENRTGAMLERGPIAIFESGSFLGQGMLDPLPDGATATVPFALERALAVDSARTDTIEGARLVRIAHNEITIERYRVTRTSYHVRNGMDHPVRVVARQDLASDSQLFQPPAGTETANGAALVPVQVPPRSDARTEVQTRVAFAQTTDWTDENAAEAIQAYLHDGHPDAAMAQVLQTALDLRRQLIDLGTQRQSLTERLDDLRQNADETRMNLLTIQHNRAAGQLRTQLTARLAQMATQIDQLTRQQVELDTQIGERRVRLSESVREIQLDLSTSSSPAPHA